MNRANHKKHRRHRKLARRTERKRTLRTRRALGTQIYVAYRRGKALPLILPKKHVQRAFGILDN